MSAYMDNITMMGCRRRDGCSCANVDVGSGELEMGRRVFSVWRMSE